MTQRSMAAIIVGTGGNFAWGDANASVPQQLLLLVKKIRLFSLFLSSDTFLAHSKMLTLVNN